MRDFSHNELQNFATHESTSLSDPVATEPELPGFCFFVAVLGFVVRVALHKASMRSSG